jgi:SET domain-containing protein
MSFDLPDGTTLDGRLAFNPVRFLNHRCEPNCSAYYAHGHLRIYAIADIAPGEELTLDYQLSRPTVAQRPVAAIPIAAVTAGSAAAACWPPEGSGPGQPLRDAS